MSRPTPQDVLHVELLIDRIGLYEVLSLIEAVCASKAEHIRANWQDDGLAKLWDKAGAEVCAVSSLPVIAELCP